MPVKMISISEYRLHLRDTLKKFGEKFEETFKIPLTSFWDKISGFNIVLFDRWMGQYNMPEGILLDRIEVTFGTDASILIEKMLDEESNIG